MSWTGRSSDVDIKRNFRSRIGSPTYPFAATPSKFPDKICISVANRVKISPACRQFGDVSLEERPWTPC